jgi:hypothetical protein
MPPKPEKPIGGLLFSTNKLGSFGKITFLENRRELVWAWVLVLEIEQSGIIWPYYASGVGHVRCGLAASISVFSLLGTKIHPDPL